METYVRCLSSAKNKYGSDFEPIRKRDSFKDSEKRTYYSIDSEYSLVLNSNDLEKCSLKTEKIEKATINKSRLLHFSVRETTLLFGSGVGGYDGIFSFKNGVNFNISTFSDKGNDGLLFIDSL